MAITLDARDLNARRGSSPRGAMADDARARAFRQARRHSRLVRLLRLWPADYRNSIHRLFSP